MNKEKLLTIRIDVRLYQQFKDLVKFNDSSVSDVLRDFIKDCVENQSIHQSRQNIDNNSSIQSEEIHKKLYADLYTVLYNELKSDIDNAIFTHKLEFHSEEIIDPKPLGVAKTEENLVNRILDITNAKSLTLQGLQNDPNQGVNDGEGIFTPEDKNKGKLSDSDRGKNEQECDRILTYEESKAKIMELYNLQPDKDYKAIMNYLVSYQYPNKYGKIEWSIARVIGIVRNILKPQKNAGTAGEV